MRPSMIADVLNLAFKARKNDEVFNPLFVGPPGLGKSQIVQQWCRTNNLPFIDLRAAYLESPDLIGYPSVEIIEGRQVTVHNIPEFWPSSGEGVLLLEEPNRGTTSVMNTFMQILTDRKVHKYTLPKGWIIVGCINPENEENDVTTMDPALKDRFEIFNVDYDRADFVNFVKSANWDQSVINYIETNTWTYLKPEEVGKTEGNKYISPRTLSKLNTAIKTGMEEHSSFERTVYDSILGKNLGGVFYYFKNNEQPVLYSDLENPKTMESSLEKLKIFSNPANYKSGSIAVTIRDIVETNKISDELLVQVLLVLPADQGPALISELSFIRKDKENLLLKRIQENFPEVKKYLKGVLRQK